jgi:hypothetical protein
MRFLAAVLPLFGLFSCSSGSALLKQIDADDDFSDEVVSEVVLLQSQMEMQKQKGQSLMDASADEWKEDAEYASAVEASCASELGARTPESPTLFEDMAAGDALVSLPSRADDVDVEPVVPTEKAEACCTATLGTILEVMACALLVDILRRCMWKAKDENGGDEKALAPTESSPTRRLLAAALAGDDQAFEANYACSKAELLEVDVWGCTALHYAAKGGSVHIISRMIDLGAKVDVIDAWDETPLHLAARAGCTQACARLLKAGANVNPLNAEDQTPLIVAGLAGHEATCSLLLERGASAGGLSDVDLPALVSRLLLVKVLTDSPSPNSIQGVT